MLLFATFFYTKNTFYFFYVTCLNYWDTNLLFLLLIALLFVPRVLNLFCFSSFLMFFKKTFFANWLFYKKLLTTLIVGTVTIHPLAFYVFTTIFFINFFYKATFHRFSKVPLSFSSLSYFLFFTLFLGALWATQSNSWGYFWVNDAVEWLLLLTVLYTLNALHFWLVSVNFYNFGYFYFMLFNYLLLVRFNFVPTRHNFISTNLVVYIIFFTFLLVFLLLNTTPLYCKRTGNLSFVFICFCLFFYFVPLKLFILKYVFWVVFLFFFINRLCSYVKSVTLHYLLLGFLALWLQFFNFFFLNYGVYDTIIKAPLTIFSTLLGGGSQLFFKDATFSLLDCFFFINSHLHLSVSLVLHFYSFTINLNNLNFIFLFYFIFFFLKKGWI